MKLIRNYKWVERFNVTGNALFVLINNDNRSSIKRMAECTGEIEWEKDIASIYDFAVLGNKIFATTGTAPQKTYVLSANTGEIIDEDFKAVLHLPLFSRRNKIFICFATYNGQDVDLRFKKDFSELETINFKDVQVSTRLDENYFLSIQKSIVQLHDYERLNWLWELNLTEVIAENYASSLAAKLRLDHIELEEDTIVIAVNDIRNYIRYLFGVSLRSGHIKWHHQGYSNFELHGGKLYNVEFYGLLRVLNPHTGEMKQEINLENEFERMDINCEHRFRVTDSYIYFKHAIQGKFGLLNLETLKIEDLQQLPEGNTMSIEETPFPVGSRLYVLSAPQKNLFVYEK